MSLAAFALWLHRRHDPRQWTLTADDIIQGLAERHDAGRIKHQLDKPAPCSRRDRRQSPHGKFLPIAVAAPDPLERCDSLRSPGKGLYVVGAAEAICERKARRGSFSAQKICKRRAGGCLGNLRHRLKALPEDFNATGGTIHMSFCDPEWIAAFDREQAGQPSPQMRLRKKITKARCYRQIMGEQTAPIKIAQACQERRRAPRHKRIELPSPPGTVVLLDMG